MAKGKGGFLGQDGLNAPDQATGVSATAGDASATVSFTAPSNTGSSAITGYSVQSSNGDGTAAPSYDLSIASYDSKSLDASSQAPAPVAAHFNSDGTKIYVLDDSTNDLFQYSLSTAYDVSTGSYDSVSFDVGSQDGNPSGFVFKPDGSKVYIVGAANATIYQYSLSTPFDVNTMSYDSVSFSVSSQDTSPQGIVFNNDGTAMYVAGNTNDTIYQYTLSSEYNINTASYASKSLSVSSQENQLQGLAFNSDGTEVFIVGFQNDEVHQYDLSSPYDVSTGSYSSTSFSVSSENGGPKDIVFALEGSKMYITGQVSQQRVYQYTTGVYRYPTSSPVTVYGLTNDTSYTFRVWAINSSGWSAPSDASDAVTPLEPAWVFFSGGSNSGSMVQRVNALSAGNSTDFGDMVYGGKTNACGFGSTTRGFQAQGFLTNVIEFVLFASGGNSTDFGDGQYSSLTYAAGLSNSTRGIIAGGNQTGTQRNRIQYVTMASAGNAATFGNLLASCSQFAECASTTRGVLMGDNSNRTRMQYITIASTGNALFFGSLSTDQDFGCGFSNSTRGVVNCGDGGAGNVMEYITIASTGNSTDFGDLYVKARARPGGMAGGNIGLIAGGYNNDAASQTNVIQSVTIPTTGNSIDFGDLVSNSTELAASGNAHGGIS